MKLKYLELYGFKSFAEKTRLSFDECFVGVVGPNGSGKSNIADAIRWVLGEQSAKALRGVKMEDVIFAGTNQKARMNMAQVTIGFDNSDGSIPLDYDEVTVSRKVFRSGESEYLINQRVVRRKDIHELFLDTGIGKEGYSLIGQGRIDDILSSRSEDRRALFEEAAGIAKFKARKVEALRRLEKTLQSLENIQTEMRIKKTQLQNLKEQAEQAREAIRLTRELQDLSLSYLKQQLHDLDEKQARYQAEWEKLQADFEDSKRQKESLDAQWQPHQARLESMEETVKNMQAHVEQCRETQLHNEKRRLVLQEKKVHHEQEEKRLTEQLERVREQQEQLEARLELLRERKEKLYHVWQEQQSSTQKTVVHIEESRQVEIQEAEENLRAMERELHRLEYAREQQQKAAAAQEKHRTEVQEQLERVQAQLAQSTESWNARKTQLLQLENVQKQAAQGRADCEEKLGRLRCAQQTMEKEAEEKQRQRYVAESKLQILRATMEQYDGFFRPVAQFLKRAESEPSIRSRFVDVLAHLIEPKQEYALALEVALGSALQNIVVKTDEDAKFLIQWVKQHRLGRITFLPLNRIRGQRPRVDTHAKVLCPALAAVSYPNDLEGVMSHFLGTTTFVRDIDDAMEVSRSSKNRIISLEGDLIQSWGAMVGGRMPSQQKSGLLHQKLALAEWEKKEEKARYEVEAHQQKMTELFAEVQAVQLSLQEEDKKQREAQQAWNQTAEESYRYQSEVQSLSKEQDQLKAILEAASQEVAFDDDMLNDQRSAYAQQKERYDRLCQEESEYQKRLQEREKADALYAQQVAFAKREWELADNQYAEAEEQRWHWAQEKERLKHVFEENKKESATLNTDLQLLVTKEAEEKEAVEQAQEQLHLHREQWETGKQELSDLRNKREAAHQKLLELENTAATFSMNLSHGEEQRAQLLDNYADQYVMDTDAILYQLSILQPVPTSRKAIQEHREALSRIGYFRRESIDEYADMQAEYAFTLNQLNDLERSRGDIETLISDLDTTMEQRFCASFQAINKEYNRIFQILFQGGEARLQLESNDPLSAGIAIEAKPPGKKLQSLDLLSGGERSMTALALLFAIFAIRPTPFCVLDEIDAALDEANIGRYVHYLKTLTENTQFIVITHRKTTMELADVLHGITMEKGISKTVHLRMKQCLEEGLDNGTV